jgi:hypothetical protein
MKPERNPNDNATYQDFINLGAMIENQNGVIDAILEYLRSINGTLNIHTQILEEHSHLLKTHSVLLDSHTEMIGDIVVDLQGLKLSLKPTLH